LLYNIYKIQIHSPSPIIPHASLEFLKFNLGNDSKPEIEFLALSGLPIIGGNIKLGLRRMLDLLLDLEPSRSRSDLEDCEDAEEARRCRCIRVGSISGMFARRAKIERTAV
jgi:hypothetical protein